MGKSGLVVVVCVASTLAACCPVTVWEAYPPIASPTTKGGRVGEAKCSWGVAPGGEVVTAAHCVHDGRIGFAGGEMLIADMDPEADYAILVGDHPDGAMVFTTMAEPGTGEIACYFDFRGSPNCGHVTAVTADSVWVVFSTRLVVPGDSGSPLQLQDGDGLSGVMTNRFGGVIGRAARLPL
jgi:hypothetical protein